MSPIVEAVIELALPDYMATAWVFFKRITEYLRFVAAKDDAKFKRVEPGQLILNDPPKSIVQIYRKYKTVLKEASTNQMR